MKSGLLQRLFSETPKFFKIIRNISLSLATLSGLIIAANLAIPESFVDILTKIIAVSGITAAFISQLPTIWVIEENGVVEVKKSEDFAESFTINPDEKANPKNKD